MILNAICCHCRRFLATDKVRAANGSTDSVCGLCKEDHANSRPPAEWLVSLMLDETTDPEAWLSELFAAAADQAPAAPVETVDPAAAPAKPCKRCAGTGRWANGGRNGVCFRCGGTGDYTPAPKLSRSSWAAMRRSKGDIESAILDRQESRGYYD